MSSENSGLKVFCLITSKQGYLGADLLKKRLEEFGSVEEVAAHYICRDAATLLRQGKSQEEVRQELGYTDAFVPVSEEIIEAALGERRKNSSANAPDANGKYWWQSDDFKVKPGWNQQPFDVEGSTSDTCLRPDLYLDGRCEPCPYFARCKFDRRMINGKIPKGEKI